MNVISDSAEMPQMRPYEADRLLRLAEEYDHRALATKLRSAARNPPLHEILRDDPESLNAEALRRLVYEFVYLIRSATQG